MDFNNLFVIILLFFYKGIKKCHIHCYLIIKILPMGRNYDEIVDMR